MDHSGEEIPLLRLLPILQRITSLSDLHKKFGVTKSQMIIFLVLHYKESTTMSEIAQYICSSKEQATRAVASLCDHGLVERFEDPANRTHVFIRFTEDGKNMMKQLASQLRADIRSRLSSSLSEEELCELRQSVMNTIEILNKVK